MAADVHVRATRRSGRRPRPRPDARGRRDAHRTRRRRRPRLHRAQRRRPVARPGAAAPGRRVRRRDPRLDGVAAAVVEPVRHPGLRGHRPDVAAAARRRRARRRSTRRSTRAAGSSASCSSCSLHDARDLRPVGRVGRRRREGEPGHGAADLAPRPPASSSSARSLGIGLAGADPGHARARPGARGPARSRRDRRPRVLGPDAGAGAVARRRCRPGSCSRSSSTSRSASRCTRDLRRRGLARQPARRTSRPSPCRCRSPRSSATSRRSWRCRAASSGFIRFASYVPFWSPFVMLTRLSIGRWSHGARRCRSGC